jgi:hypothetical protein
MRDAAKLQMRTSSPPVHSLLDIPCFTWVRQSLFRVLRATLPEIISIPALWLLHTKQACPGTMKVRANTLQVLDSLRQLTEISEDCRVEATDILLQEISSSGDNRVALLVRAAPPLLDVVSGSNPALLTSCVHGCGSLS